MKVAADHFMQLGNLMLGSWYVNFKTQKYGALIGMKRMLYMNYYTRLLDSQHSDVSSETDFNKWDIIFPIKVMLMI